MLRRIACSTVQIRGLKHQVNIKWVRPDYVPAYKPEKSGDLEGLPPIPEDTIADIYNLSEELKDAPEAVKKLFSVAFMGQKEFHALVKRELVNRVKRHNYDENSAENKIARLTAYIRCLQNLMDNYPRNAKMKQTVQEMIDRRKKLLKYLRQYDYKKFEWLLEQLNIEYKGFPEDYHKLSRKESLRRLTELHCEQIKNNKLADYRNLLESQQGPFLKQKLEALKFIRSEQIELKLPVTVKEQEIKTVETQLEDWTARDKAKQEAKKKKRNLLEE